MVASRNPADVKYYCGDLCTFQRCFVVAAAAAANDDDDDDSGDNETTT